MTTFRSLGLTEPLMRSIEKLQFTLPSEIQKKTIPPILLGKDVIAQSATGSGKTLAFGVGILQNMRKGEGVKSIILTPTRELAMQVGKVLKELSVYNPVKLAIVYGGVGYNPQVKEIRDADVIVGTPGRILDHLQRNILNLSRISILVLDEADRMLDMGFIRDVEKIIGQCPKQRQTLLFSATISNEVERLAHRYMSNPMRISGEFKIDRNKLEEIYYDVDNRLKLSLLVHLLIKEKKGLVMVFCSTRKSADLVAGNLKPYGVQAMAIHGGFSQAQRSRVLHAFHSQKINVLVCTDVAARGLDIEDVSHIYNYDMPQDSKEYIHRIGRTARAGKKGKVINILSSRDHGAFSRILQDTGKKIQKVETPHVTPIRIKWRQRGRYAVHHRAMHPSRKRQQRHRSYHWRR